MAQEIFERINEIRQKPRSIVPLLEEMLTQFKGKHMFQSGQVLLTQEGPAAVEEAISYAKVVKPAGQLKWDDTLSEAAFSHCFEQGQHGTTGHVNRRGEGPSARVKHFGKFRGPCEELLSYGIVSTWDIILQLFVCDGVRSRAHRHNMLNPDVTSFGGATSQHITLGVMGSFILCGNFTPRLRGKANLSEKWDENYLKHYDHMQGLQVKTPKTPKRNESGYPNDK
jgi:hypothetical protein